MRYITKIIVEFKFRRNLKTINNKYSDNPIHTTGYIIYYFSVDSVTEFEIIKLLWYFVFLRQLALLSEQIIITKKHLS